MKTHKLVTTVFTNMHCMKPALPAEPMFLITTLLMGDPRATPVKPGY